MSHQPLIEATELGELIKQNQVNLLVADCRYALTDPAAGRTAYEQGHIPGAVYADLGDLLSAPTTGMNGRHPLPDPQAFANGLAALGANDDTLVVAYDAEDSGFAARLWWMLRWVGHDKVRVLNGGLRAWQASGGELSSEPATVRQGTLGLRHRAMPTVTFGDVLANLESREKLVLDARSPDRFRGENETIDPVGGHIPGARNRFFKDNLQADGRFKPADVLREEFKSLLGNTDPGQVINQCGSGVTACHNLLAMEVAGLQGAALYPGSWSEWCRQRDVPMERG
ncbi:MAG TPA: sulfurtransferase [Burkholderiaceae bacterium]|nr:sulfurtransferase [Burkholderiaceae bacterium]